MSQLLTDDDVESQTEGEELIKAREMRKQEVNLMPLPYLPTDTETDVSINPFAKQNLTNIFDIAMILKGFQMLNLPSRPPC